MAECIECGDEFSDERKEIGYNLCLSCGDAIVYQQAIAKSKRIGPLYSKGGLQCITDGEDLTTLGKKV